MSVSFFDEFPIKGHPQKVTNQQELTNVGIDEGFLCG